MATIELGVIGVMREMRYITSNASFWTSIVISSASPTVPASSLVTEIGSPNRTWMSP